jgi:pimeloyl-ACP methyl ester carboxylesterase
MAVANVDPPSLAAGGGPGLRGVNAAVPRGEQRTPGDVTGRHRASPPRAPLSLRNIGARPAPQDRDRAAGVLRGWLAMHMAMDRRLTIGTAGLPAELMVPVAATGVVVFAHGSGGSRRSPRNRLTAERLRERGIGTLLVDLLLPGESAHEASTFDIALLAARLGDCVDTLEADTALRALPVGLFGASTGAAAALDCAAERCSQVSAVVCRSGRPDLASALQGVHAPTLLIAGSADPAVLELNVDARRSLGGECRVAVVPGASHLFSEPGTLECAADLAADWFQRAFGSALLQPLRAARALPRREPDTGGTALGRTAA